MHEIRVYTIDACPYSKLAKRLLELRGVSFREIEVEMTDDATWDMLIAQTGLRTMPQIFAGDRVIGSFVDLDALDKQDALASLKNGEPLPGVRSD
jgi:glutaredoxin 3